MKRSKNLRTPRIAFVLLQEKEETLDSEVCREADTAQATFYNWRARYGGLMQ